MGVPQYTTPTFLLTFTQEGLDLRNATEVYVTFRSNNVVVTKTGTDLDVGEKSIGVHMAQEETGKFSEGSLRVQANWILDGERYASEVSSIRVSENMLKEVI